MAATGAGFAFGHEDAVLATIGEYDDEDMSFLNEEDASKKHEVATTKTVSLAAATEKEMAELGELLGKLKTGTATREERSRLKSLNGKLSELDYERKLRSPSITKRQSR